MAAGKQVDVLVNIGVNFVQSDQAMKKVQQGAQAALIPINKITKDTASYQKKSMMTMMRWGMMWSLIYGQIRLVMSAITGVISEMGQLDDTMGRVMTVTRTGGKDVTMVMTEMRDAVLKFAATSRQSITDVAKTLYFLGSAGLDMEQQLVGMQHVIDLTTGTVGQLDQAAKLVAGSFNVFGDSLEGVTTDAEKFKQIADTLAFVYSEQQVELDEIANAFKLVGSAAGLMDINYQDLVATLGFLNTGMLKGTRAGTSLMNAFVKIAQNADKLRTKFGIALDPTEPLNYVRVMTLLHEKVQDNVTEAQTLKQLNEVFGLRGARMVNNVLSRWDEYGISLDNARNKSKDFASLMAKQMNETLPGAITVFSNKLKSGVIDGLTAITDTLRETIVEVNQFIEENDTLIEQVKRIAKERGIELRTAEEIEKAYKSQIKPLDTVAGYFEKTKESGILIFSALKSILGVTSQVAEESKKNETSLFKATKHAAFALANEKERVKAAAMLGISVEELNGWLKEEEATQKAITGEINKQLDGTKEILELNTEQQRALTKMRGAALAAQKGEFGASAEVIATQKLLNFEKEIAGLSETEVEREAVLAEFARMRNASIEEIYNNTLLRTQLGSELMSYEKLRLEVLKASNEELVKTAKILKTGVHGMIMDIVDGTLDWQKAIADVGRKMVSMAAEQFVQKWFIEPIFDTAVSTFENAEYAFKTDVDMFNTAVNSFGTYLNTFNQESVFGGKGQASDFYSPLADSVKKGTQKGVEEAAKKQSKYKKIGDVGLGGWVGMGAAAYGAYQGGSPVGGAMSGAMMGAAFGPPGMIIGAAAGAILGALGSKDKKDQVSEQTKQITSKINITNRLLEVTNRNLSALKEEIRPYPLPESYYFSSEAARGWVR